MFSIFTNFLTIFKQKINTIQKSVAMSSKKTRDNYQKREHQNRFRSITPQCHFQKKKR